MKTTMDTAMDTAMDTTIRDAKHKANLEKSIIRAYARAQKRACKKAVVTRVTTFESLCRALKLELSENADHYPDYRGILPNDINVSKMLSIKDNDGVAIYLVATKRKAGKFPLFGANWEFVRAKQNYEGVVASLRSFARLVEQAESSNIPAYLPMYKVVRETVVAFAGDILEELR